MKESSKVHWSKSATTNQPTTKQKKGEFIHWVDALSISTGLDEYDSEEEEFWKMNWSSCLLNVAKQVLLFEDMIRELIVFIMLRTSPS